MANFAEWTREVSPVLPAGLYSQIVAFNDRIYVNKAGPNYADDQMYVKINGSWQIFEEQFLSDRYSMEVYENRMLICNNLALDVYKPDGTIDYRIWTYDPGSVSPRDALMVENNVVWIGDQLEGLVKVTNI